jgi:hypothetical protein
MDKFTSRRRKYSIILDQIQGSGYKYSSIAENAYNKMKDAYEQLDENEKENVSLPSKINIYDDGTNGLSMTLRAVYEIYKDEPNPTCPIQ